MLVGSGSHGINGGVCKRGVLNLRDMSGGMFLVGVGALLLDQFCPLSFVVCIVVLGLVMVAGTMGLGLVVMGGSDLACLNSFALGGIVLE